MSPKYENDAEAALLQAREHQIPPPPLPRAPHMPNIAPRHSSAPVDLDGNVKLGIKTLTSLFVIVIGSVISLMGLWSTLMTRSEVSEVLSDHNSRMDAHPEMSKALGEIQTRSVTVSSRIQRLEEQQAETSGNVEYIRSRIDFLTEQTIREAAEQRAGHRSDSTHVGERAVQRFRASGDPQRALDDL